MREAEAALGAIPWGYPLGLSLGAMEAGKVVALYKVSEERRVKSAFFSGA